MPNASNRSSPPWPELRSELALYPGPEGAQGEPTWSLHDPLRNLFFRIDWLTFEILCRWPLADPELIVQSLRQDTTLRVGVDDLQAVVDFLQQHELIKRTTAGHTQQLSQRVEQRKRSRLTWLLHHYLFFRVPLWRPDAWLERTQHRVQLFGSRPFVWLTMLVLLLGLFEVSRQWDSFTSTLVDLFSVQGVIAYGVTLICVKFLHELGHAYVAKRLGCRVPTMGVAFLVMFPMAYTDVNDAWKLPSRRQRLQVGAAGIRTELTLAIWATLAWAMLPDGGLRTGVFLLATTTWISTLLINASPFMRFDGYFLLMDLMNLPNLHQRAFALARWDLRERLFRLNDPVPEVFALRRRRLLILFAWGTWLYRLMVFTGIAVMVYLMFPKPLGPLLAGIEIVWFILRPIGQELKHWAERKEDIMKSTTSLRTLFALLILAAVMLLPWDNRIQTQAVARPEYRGLLLAPGNGQIKTILHTDGESVKKGDVLMALSLPDLEYQYRSAQARLQGLERKLNASRITPELHERQAVMASERQAVMAEIRGAELQLQRHQLRADQDGIVKWSDPDIQPGSWVSKNESLGQVVQPSVWRVYGQLPETERDRVEVNDHARFFVESGNISPLSLKVVRIDSDTTRVLSDGLLASTRGGEILVREQGEQLYPEMGLYRLILQPDPEAEALLASGSIYELRGRLVLYGERRSWVWHYWRSAAALLRRELGF